MLRRLALIASALTGVPLAVAWFLSEQVLHPRPRVEDNSLETMPLPAEPVSFASRDGTRLAGWFVPAAGGSQPAPGVVLSHGWARSRCELLPHARFLHRAGFAVLMFDYRHRGESAGDAITMGVRERSDLLGAIDTLCARPEVDAARVGVFGMSMGGVVAVLVGARDERVRAICAEAPFATHQTIMTRSLRHYFHLPSFPIAYLTRWIFRLRVGAPLDDIDPIDYVAGFSPRPIFIIACGRDAVIGCEETERVYAAAAEPKRFWRIEEADHARGWQTAGAEYEERVAAYFQETLAQAEPAYAGGRSAAT
jgi:dipeptidyl aminopeptidase/acylaminoacyl peptidase